MRLKTCYDREGREGGREGERWEKGEERQRQREQNVAISAGVEALLGWSASHQIIMAETARMTPLPALGIKLAFSVGKRT